MFKIRVMCLFFFTLLLFFLFYLCNLVADKEETMKRYFSRLKVELKTSNKELRMIKTKLEDARNQIAKVQRTRRPQVVIKKFPRRAGILPKWIQRFDAPRWTDFKP